MAVVFTNGCFDLLHPGHIDLLTRARALGSRLVVGLNSDASVKALKGRDRPLLSQQDRSAMLLALKAVDEVVIFDELTPEALIRRIRPDVLVKGGDYTIDQIAGAEFVQSYGGQVRVLSLVEGYSTTSMLQRVAPGRSSQNRVRPGETALAELAAVVGAHQETLELFRGQALGRCAEIGARIADRLASGSKLLVCGNGGSAADAQHLAAELMVRFQSTRRPLPAVALTTDTSLLTAHANDFGYSEVFARQVEGLAAAGDVLVAISTSGKSPSILAACQAGNAKGCYVVGLTGESGGDMPRLCKDVLHAPSSVTARIQEVHVLVLHLWCEQIDRRFAR